MKIAIALSGWAAMLVAAVASPVHAQDNPPAAQPRTLDDMPCPPMPVISPERMSLIVEPKPHITQIPPASETDRANYMRWSKIDPEGVCWYREANRSLPRATDHRVIFLGDSITESWKPSVPALFTGDILDRGVSGQTTTQMLARFRTDVIDLHPAVVHIMGGINDIHSPPGTALTRSNIESMVELARANGITVVLGAVTPSSLFRGASDKSFGEHIAWLNRGLRDYAAKKGLIFVDYHASLQDRDLGIRDGLSNDGIHPNRLAFQIMTPLARDAIDRALRSRATEASADPILLRELVYASAPYPEAHASTIVETRAGTLATAWFGGTKERNPDVAIWFARRGKDAWETPVQVANGIQPVGPRLPTWNPVLFQDPKGDLQLFYKVGPSPSTWWGMVITSSDDGRTWSKPQRLPEGILGPIKNKPVLLANGDWLSPSSVEKPNDGWAVHFERSSDRGQSWKTTAPVASPLHIDAIQPSILFHRDGALEAVMRTRQGALGMSWSRDNGATWSPIAAIDLPNPNSGTDAVTLRDGRQLLVYNHSAHRAESPGKGPRWPLKVALSDDGVTWRNVLTLESEPVTAGYAYPAVIQTADGMVHITYTFNRVRIRHVVLDPRQLH